MRAQSLGRKQHLVFPCGIGQGDKGELAPAGRRRTALLPPSHHAGHAKGFRAVADARRHGVVIEGDALTPQEADHVLQRMSAQVEADGGQFLVKPVDRIPDFDLWQTRACAVEPRPRTGSPATRPDRAARLWAWPISWSAAATIWARLGWIESSAPARARLSSARLLTCRGSTRCQEIEQVGKPPACLAHLNEVVHGPSPNVADGPQGIEHLAVFNLEVGARSIDIRRQDGDAQAFGVLVENRELVGVGDVQAHRGGEELDRSRSP